MSTLQLIQGTGYLSYGTSLGVGQEIPMAVYKASSTLDGFTADATTVNPYGNAYRPWFRPNTTGQFALTGSVCASIALADGMARVGFDIREYTTIGGAVTGTPGFRSYFSCWLDYNRHRALVGPHGIFPGQPGESGGAGPGTASYQLRSDRWYQMFLLIWSTDTYTHFDFNDRATITLHSA